MVGVRAVEVHVEIDSSEQQRPSFSAGALSLIAHALLLAALGVFISPPPAPSLGHPERTVQIRLVDTESVRHPIAPTAEPAAPVGGESNVSASAAASTAVASLPSLADVLPAANAPTLPDRSAAQANPAVLPPSISSLAGSQSGGATIATGIDVEKIVADEQARLAAGRPVGEPTAVSLFGSGPASGRSFVFLIDRSQSMGSGGLGALAAAESELTAALVALKPHHRFQVVAYHFQCEFLVRRELLPATDDNKRLVIGFVKNLAAVGATHHDVGLLSALAQQPDAIFLLTDGGEPGLTSGQIRQLTRLAGDKTAIHCVQFGFGPPSGATNFLTELARLTSGGFTYVDMSKRK